AGRLARHLRWWGVGPEVAVGICLERSAEVIVALLGVLKAGGAYVPMDPSAPAERLAFMVRHSGMAVALTSDELTPLLPPSLPALGIGDSVPEAVIGEDLAFAAPPESAAYVIYTSGSTGRPKGVVVEHRQIASYLGGVLERLDLPDGASYATVSTFAADLGNTVIFAALATGGCLHVVAQERVADGERLGDYFERFPVDCLKIVPSHLAALLESSRPERVLPRRLLVLGGEASQWRDLERIGRLAPGCRVLNHYGPTETTVGVTTFEPARSMAPRRSPNLPLGQPMGDSRAYVLGPRGVPLPAGVPGELFLGGSHVSRGYLNAPDLAAERFLPDPFTGQSGDRMYRTGDLVRRLPEGDVDFLGRIDHQVKIRGFRVELREIEAVLAEHPTVRETVVMAREDRPGERNLVAYVVTAPGGEISPAELRGFLAERLPDYMLPAAFVAIPALPLTANGKVDLRSLPEPAQPVDDAEQDAPRTPAEELLAEIWAGVLGRERVGVHDDFFTLGGHSLLATRVVSRIRQVFQADLPLRSLFEAPTVAELAGRLAAARRPQPLPPIRPVARTGDLPLGFAQERLWFLDQLLPGQPAYNLPYFVRLEGRLEAAVLERALSEVVRRHEILRSVFPARGGRPVQEIAPALALPLCRIDLRGLPVEARREAVERLVVSEARRPFDLQRQPLLRARLLVAGEEESFLLLSMHHIVSDAWSRGVLLREAVALYGAFLEGRPSPLPEPSLQYVDFAVWQREWLQGERLERHLAHWRHRLEGTPSRLDLPVDRPRPALATFRGAAERRALPAVLGERLKGLARREGATPFMVLLAAFQALLHRYTRQEKIPVGSPIANRNRAEVEGLIGFFVNTLVLVTDLAGDPEGRDLLARAREVALDAYAHQDLPFEKLVAELEPERDLGSTPLFQVVLVLQNAPQPPLGLPGLRLDPVEVHSGVAKFDLTLTFAEDEGVFHAFLEYNRDLFEAATARRLLGHFEHLLDDLATDPARRVSDLSLLTASELEQLLAWNRAGVAAGGSECLHRLFEIQAALRPEAVAVVCESEALTYGELAGQARRLAAALRTRGVGPESRVGLCAERSVELVVGLLGILGAGGAYVPLDPAYPQERLAYILGDAGISVLLTQSGLVEKLAGCGAELLLLDTGSPEETAGGPVHAAEPVPDNLAYIIYTSGSTGRPKGVPVTHRNVVRLFEATQVWFGFGLQDIWTLFHSPAFDFSVWEIWGALLFGGRLVVVPHWVSRSSDAFHQLLVRERVTVLNQTPSAFRQLIAADGSADLSDGLSLRLVIFGGEALELSSLRPWYERHGDREPLLVNMYGITETTVHVTHRPLGWADLEGSASSVIGRAIPDLRLYLLDRHLQPVPVGVAGELAVGGAGLARGYLGRPELTAQRFMPDPFAGGGEEPGARLYRSGDLARYRTDGDLEYLGRIDHQVKIRGFRIELGEIEAALARHAGVREVVVLAREDEPGNRRLVAYVVPSDQPAPSIAELRNALSEVLPDYMVPAAFVLLGVLPLTAHGKLDRSALPAPDVQRSELLGSYALPRSPEEGILAEVWAEVLGLDRVGIHDNFFALGGDSILSLRVRALAQARGVDFSLPDLFLHQTVAALAQVLGGSATAEDELPAIGPFGLVAAEDRAGLPGDVEDAYPLTLLQRGMLFHSDYSGEATAYHNVSALRVRTPLDLAALRQAVQDLAVRHAVLRTSFRVAGFSQPLQFVHRDVEVPFEVLDLRSLAPADQERFLAAWFEAERESRFEWHRPPLLRFAVQILDEDHFQLGWTEHHAILDGWSVASMLAELFQLYFARLGVGEAPPPPPSATFREFVALEQRAAASDEARSFWIGTVGDSTFLELPRRALSPVGGEEGRSHEMVLRLPASTVSALRAVAESAGAPLKSALLAAHLRVLSLVGGRPDVVTGVVANGRPEVDGGDRIFGLFLNTLPLRLRLEPGTWRDLVRATFTAERKAMPYRRFPLAELQRLLGGRPLFEVMFNYIHFHVLDSVRGLHGV
ncbi:MAG TPA: amino acid adenylation domain-containing protein, partial [Thermoanaerobaculia bacterium]|nr:amino acid adenylation domain-containing protein [Thermoanaerobaculia bacterium]